MDLWHCWRHVRHKKKSKSDQTDGDSGPGRIFILVDPFTNASRHLKDIDHEGTLLDHARRMLTMVRGESVAKDFLRVRETNAEVEHRDRLVLAMAALAPALDAGALGGAAAQLHSVADPATIAHAVADGDGAPEPAERVACARVEELLDQDRLAGAGGAVPGGAMAEDDPRRELIRRMAAALDGAAPLGRKRKLTARLIGADPDKLAGDAMAGFGGFFVKEWREHDYRIGRTAARERLPAVLDLTAAVPAEEGVDIAIPREWAGFPRAKLGQAPRAHVTAVRDLIAARAEEAIRAALGSSAPWTGGRADLGRALSRAAGAAVTNAAFRFYGRRKLRSLVEDWMLS